MIQHVNEAEFQKEVLESELPVLVDFWAEWCGPCKAIAPILDEISRDYESKLRVVKVDADQNQNLLRQLNIRGIPTLFLYKNGAVIASRVGALSKSQLELFLHTNL